MSMLVALLFMGVGGATTPGLFVIGIDGMDPVILQRLMKEGRTPHLARLAKQGGFQLLQTVTPPQSPVAWSSFATGMNPGGHGIFDFIHRDPHTYRPLSSATRPPGAEATAIDLFGYYLPLGGTDPQNNRAGVPFWDVLAESGVPVEVYRMPAHFPVPPSRTKVLAGMGVVDLRGGYGTYTLYTSRPLEKKNPKGDVQVVSVEDFDLNGIADTATGVLRGAPDVFRLPPGVTPKPNQYLSQRITFHIDPQFPTVLVEVGGAEVLLQEGEWSRWVEVDFPALPAGVVSFAGVVRFYVKQVRPDLQIYASPVNISAASPSQPISSPEDFASTLYARQGHFYTQGMPEEVDALKDGVFTDAEYIQQVALVQKETRAMLETAIQRFVPGGFTFFYVSDIDLQCHMLWRHGDPKFAQRTPHPAYNSANAPRFKDTIASYYESADALVGRVLAKVPVSTQVVVLSDHGFVPFRRQVNLNAWLRDRGYLVFKRKQATGHVAQGDVDWSQTQAYALGFNGLYLNRRGREKHGVVSADVAPKLARKLAAELAAWRDPTTGMRVVHRAVLASEHYRGKRVNEAPDLVVGYNQPYGPADAGVLGFVGQRSIEDNVSKWSGSHMTSAEQVPGVLLANRPLAKGTPRITQLAATFLAHFGVDAPREMESPLEVR